MVTHTVCWENLWLHWLVGRVCLCIGQSYEQLGEFIICQANQADIWRVCSCGLNMAFKKVIFMYRCHLTAWITCLGNKLCNHKYYTTRFAVHKLWHSTRDALFKINCWLAAHIIILRTLLAIFQPSSPDTQFKIWPT